MNKVIKHIGIIAFSVIMVFGFIACDSGGDDDNTQKTNAEVPSITAEPVDGVYLPGATVTPLSVTASSSDGGVLSYQWYSSATNYGTGDAITGATNNTFTPPAVTVGTLYYYVEVTNTNNSVDGNKTAVRPSSRAKFVVGWEAVEEYSNIENPTSYAFSPKSIVFANNLFVAVGGFVSSGGQIGWSNDGINWTVVANTTFGTSIINGIAYGNNRFIAVGDNGKMASSADGKTWASLDVSIVFGTSNINDIAYGNNRFFAVAEDNKSAYLTDGSSTWTGASVSQGSLRRIVYGANTFMAYGTHSSIANGANYYFGNSSTNWSLLGNIANFMILDLISTGTNLVEVGANGNVWKLISVPNWTEIKPSSIMGTDTISKAAYGASKLIVFSLNKAAWSSDDGTTWTELPFADISRMVYGAGRFVGVAGGSGIVYSSYQ